MQIDIEYSKALAELDVLFETFDENIVKKIPIKLREFIRNYKSKDYVVKFKTNENIHKKDLQLKTRELLAYIYRNYLCDDDERQDYDKILKNNENKYQEELKNKYDANNLFKNNTKIETKKKVPQNYEMVNYKKNTFWTRIIEKIKHFIQHD